MANNRVIVKPKDAATKVRMQNGTGYVPVNGVEVELTTYYRRRINDGDLVIVSPKGKHTQE